MFRLGPQVLDVLLAPGQCILSSLPLVGAVHSLFFADYTGDLVSHTRGSTTDFGKLVGFSCGALEAVWVWAIGGWPGVSSR